MTYMHHLAKYTSVYETMNAVARMDLNSASIATVPQQDNRRIILDFVRSQQSFAKAYAKEGKTYMASWKDGTETTRSTSERERPPQSCGFTTPVLKPRARPRAGTSSHNEQHPKRGHELEAKSDCSNSAHKVTQAKPRNRATRREEQRKNSPKRGPDHQTDEEQRLQERREKKKARRDIMKPQSSKKKADVDDSQSKTKKKKQKQKLPSGLALMYGFTASNVGQKRLTVDPLSRPGVFGKGKASVQTAVKRSKQKSSRNNAVFSESVFLNSAGKGDLKKGGTPGSTESDSISSEPSDGQELLEQEPQVRRVARNNHKSEAGPVTRPSAVAVAKDTSKAVEQNLSTNSSPHKASSVIWDIEKISGVLPTDSSSLVSLGPKPSTLLLDVAHKGWTFERSPTNAEAGPGPSIQQANLAITPKPPSVQSIRPSESPSQVNHPEGVSKYFPSGPPPPAECHTYSPKDMDCMIEIPEAAACVPTASPEVDTPGSLDNGVERLAVSDNYELGPDPELFFSEEITQYPQRDLDDSDWLLSDPVLGKAPTLFPIEDDWAALDGILTTRLDGGHEDDPTALEQMDCLYEQISHDGAHSLWLGEEPLPDHFSDELLGFNEYDGIPDLEQTIGDNVGLDQKDLTDPESDVSESDLQEYINFSLEDIHDAENDPLIRFNEGRYLLHGYRTSEAINNLEFIEADVAQSLVGHWKPQKY